MHLPSIPLKDQVAKNVYSKKSSSNYQATASSTTVTTRTHKNTTTMNLTLQSVRSTRQHGNPSAGNRNARMKNGSAGQRSGGRKNGSNFWHGLTKAQKTAKSSLRDCTATPVK